MIPEDLKSVNEKPTQTFGLLPHVVELFEWENNKNDEVSREELMDRVSEYMVEKKIETYFPQYMYYIEEIFTNVEYLDSEFNSGVLMDTQEDREEIGKNLLRNALVEYIKYEKDLNYKATTIDDADEISTNVDEDINVAKFSTTLLQCISLPLNQKTEFTSEEDIQTIIDTSQKRYNAIKNEWLLTERALFVEFLCQYNADRFTFSINSDEYKMFASTEPTNPQFSMILNMIEQAAMESFIDTITTVKD